MKKVLMTLYSGISYLSFTLVCLSLPLFLLELEGINTINHGEENSLLTAITINIALVSFLGLNHSVMTQDWYKRWLTRIVPAAQRSSYVLQASVLPLLVMGLWQPMPQVIWSLSGWAMLAAYALFAFGLVVVFWSTQLSDHFELFGPRQVRRHRAGELTPASTFRTLSHCRLARHPMRLGIVMVLFASPQMTAGHFLLAGMMTLHILIGVMIEERALVREFGGNFWVNQRMVPMLTSHLRPVAAPGASHADAEG